MCWVELIDRKRAEKLMLMMGLNAEINQLATANSVCSYGNVLRRGVVMSLGGYWTLRLNVRR